MAATTQFLPNEYMVFEADQVLTNDHLNQLFNYLDQQNRWTRNKLIGIGIVCGLDIVQHTGVIEVTKGCGVTSQGYLIIQEAKQYSYYLPYSGIDQPNDLPFKYPNNALPFYKTFCAGKPIYSLLTDDDYNALEADAKSGALLVADATTNLMLNDYAVVLFLEANEMDLKNCDLFDCNNKGEKMLLNLRALLVLKTQLPTLQKKLLTIPIDITRLPNPITTIGNVNRLSSIRSTIAKPAVATTLGNASSNILGNIPGNIFNTGFFPFHPINMRPPEINLQRFNVPYTDIKTSDDVINAFLKLVDDATLSSVAYALNYCYNHYQNLLDTTAGGFPTLYDDLKAQRDAIIKNNPVFIQYFYDFIDDLKKAHDEFRAKVSLLLSACCPDENLFPLHLVLGAATAATKDFAKDAYRTYFMYSPLFARQENEISETQFLFRRMQIMVTEFVMVNADSPMFTGISVLPSLYRQALLSQRAIPYYYTVNESGNELYKYWNYYKTVRDNAAANISYNASQYSYDIPTLNPLLYDIEKYDFFRIEGHIGINYQTALTTILQQQKNYNLPFDVVAISADQLPMGGVLPQCNIQDLDTNYKLLISEFSCKVHTPFCFITKLAYPPQATFVAGTVRDVGNINIGGIASHVEATSNLNLNTGSPSLQFNPALASGSFSNFKLQAAADTLKFNFPIFRLGYRKGDFMRKYCTPTANTIGSVYLSSLSATGVFTNPVQLSAANGSLISYYRLFDYVDAVESLMQVLMPATLTTIDMDAFLAAYKRFTDSLFAVTFAVTEIMNERFGTSDNTAFQFFKEIEMDVLVDEISMPVYDCLDERLQTLQTEYSSRLQQYQAQLGFYNYYNKHYGLEHKAGVPKGGTFVLVYHPAAPQNATTGSAAGFATSTTVSSQFTQFNPNFSKAEQASPAVTGAKLFMAKTPKAVRDKTDIKTTKATTKKEAATTITEKDTVIKRPVNEPTKIITEQPVRTGLGSISATPQQPPIVTAAGPGRVIVTGIEQPVATGTVNVNQPIHEPIKTIVEQPVFTATQPGIGSTRPVVSNPIFNQPQNPILTATGAGIGIAGTPVLHPVFDQPKNPVFTQPTGTAAGGSINPTGASNLLDQNTLNLIKNFANSSAGLTGDSKQSFLNFLNLANLQLVGSQFTVADNVVIADFYVPYLCCSDCPPVAYILPPPVTTPPPVETPEFSIASKEYVNNDNKNYAFTAKPLVTNDNKNTDPFASDAISNAGNLHLLTDDKNVLYLHPFMPDLNATITATVAYQNIPIDITIIKPDASFTINETNDAAGSRALQLVPADANADTYKWTVNEIEGIFENTKSPGVVSIQEIKNKTQSSSFTIALTTSYTRNDVAATDTQTQTYQTSVCIDFETFQLNTVYGPQIGQKEGDIAFTTDEKIVAKVWPFLFPRDSTFGVAMVVISPQEMSTGQCLQLNNINMEFDYSNSSLQPTQVTFLFFTQGGFQNLSVNDSDPFIGQLSKVPPQIKDIAASVKMATDQIGILTLSGDIKTFKIGGQEFFIDNVCAQ